MATDIRPAHFVSSVPPEEDATGVMRACDDMMQQKECAASYPQPRVRAALRSCETPEAGRHTGRSRPQARVLPSPSIYGKDVREKESRKESCPMQGWARNQSCGHSCSCPSSVSGPRGRRACGLDLSRRRGALLSEAVVVSRGQRAGCVGARRGEAALEKTR